MLPLTVKLLAAITCFTAVYLTTEAADTCPTATMPCMPGLPGLPGRGGKDGRDGMPGRNGNDGVAGFPGRDGVAGPPGRDGRDGVAGVNDAVGQPGPSGPQGPPGLPGALNDTEQQQLKEDILNTLRDEINVFGCCNTQPTPCEQNATSCKELYECNPGTPSGYYNIRTPQGVESVYCKMDPTNCGNSTGGWMRAAYINMMNDPSTCPQQLTYTIQSSTRMCRAAHASGSTCTSVIFPTHSVPYTKVCGRVRGYHYNTNEAFNAGTSATSPDEYYFDGLSVTHGSPRNHIWTFAVGSSKDYNYPSNNCPCAAPYPGPDPPSFVGENYFCESGRAGPIQDRWYLDDPLWDSQGCASGSTCCDRGGPWFTTSLNTRDDIEVRWCFYEGTDEDVGVDELEIYVY